MRDFIGSALSVAVGIIIAAACISAAYTALQPAANVVVSLVNYDCITNGAVIECQRK